MACHPLIWVVAFRLAYLAVTVYHKIIGGEAWMSRNWEPQT